MILQNSSASKVCLILLPLHNGDETEKRESHCSHVFVFKRLIAMLCAMKAK